MNIINRFTLLGMRKNKKRTAVTIIGVIISAAMITAVATFISSFLSFVQRDEIATNGNWHAEIKSVQAQNVGTIIHDSSVKDFIISRDLGYAKLENAASYTKPFISLRQYDKNGFSQMSVNIKSGRLPQKSGEVVVSENLQTGSNGGYKVGETVQLQLGKRISSDGKELNNNEYLQYDYDDNGQQKLLETFAPVGTQSFTIVGVISAPSFEKSFSSGYGMVGYLDRSSLSPSDTVNIYLTASHIDRSVFSTIPPLAEKAGVPKENVSFNKDLLRYYGVESNDNIYTFMQIFEYIIILIIMAASVSLIYNAFAISVSERSKQLGLLASVGATKRQKRRSVYFEGFIIGIIGIPLGILAGLGGMAVTLAALQPLVDSFIMVSSGVKLILVPSVAAIITAVVFSAITIFVSVYIPAHRASRITPIDAIRQTDEVKLTRKAVKTSRLTRALFGFEAEIALKNLKRSRKKYRATIVSLAISLVLFLTVASYTSTMQNVYGSTNSGYDFDICVNYAQNMKDSVRADLDTRIKTLDLIKSYTAASELGGDAELSPKDLTDYTKEFCSPDDSGKYDFQIMLTGLDSKSFEEYAKAAGANDADYTDVKNPKAILINHGQDYDKKSKALKKISGDVLTLSKGDNIAFSTGDESSKATRNITIGAVTDQRPMGTVASGFSYVKLIVPESVFDEVTKGLNGQQKNDINYSSFMTTDDDQKLESQLSDISKSANPGFYIVNIKSEARTEENMMTFLNTFVYGFIILISLICIANIFNTVSTNISLRRKEFAMLRSVGMTPKGFNKMIRFESIFYGLKGLLYGLPVSVFIAFILYIFERSVLSTDFTLPWISYGIAIVMILIIVFVTMMYSTHRIKKENIIDALREENT